MPTHTSGPQFRTTSADRYVEGLPSEGGLLFGSGEAAVRLAIWASHAGWTFTVLLPDHCYCIKQEAVNAHKCSFQTAGTASSRRVQHSQVQVVAQVHTGNPGALTTKAALGGFNVR
eukprot:2099-Pelagomonas_calceolata.AAC.3